MIEAICFDMDGILFDTERLSVESWIAVAEKLGLGNIEKGVYGCIGLNRTDCRIFLKEVYGEDFPYDYFREQTSALFQERVEKEGLPVMKGGGDMVEHSKPLPDIYLKACELLGVKPENAIAIEDSPNGIRSAAAAGMLPVMVPDMVEPTPEIEELLYHKCDSLFAVRDFLEDML